MRSESADQHERMLRLVQRYSQSASAAGLIQVRSDEVPMTGGRLVENGREMLNFGDCSYLGLALDDRLAAGAVGALERYGVLYSSSPMYSAVALYDILEAQMQEIFGAAVVLPATTTLGHLAALPVLVGPSDRVLVDAQAHASVHLALQVLKADGIPVSVLPHNDIDALAGAVESQSAGARRLWYLGDGVYSMHGDTAPVEEIDALLARYDNLHVYLDDAHGFSWAGTHGRGIVLSRMAFHRRLVVAAGLAKSFGSGGAVIAFGDPAEADRVKRLGGTMTFSGPIHPPTLGAAVASASIHLSPEIVDRQQRMRAMIDAVVDLADEAGVELADRSPTPIWFVPIGAHSVTVEVVARMKERGFFLNIASFPAVPVRHSGVRFTHTLHHSVDDLALMLRALGEEIRQVRATSVTIDLTDGAVAESLEDAASRADV